MLSLAALLNPVRPELRGASLPSSPPSSRCTPFSDPDSPPSSTQSLVKRQKMSKDGAVFIKSKVKGKVNYPPFEDLDQETLREVRKFQVYPLGKIEEYSRHIPYNSEKKNFLEKTGRESLEVFQYTFKVPRDEKEYTVMWDYNIGLVRITPFFKCCRYSKTTPAKMLNMNPGLKEITHSITGGALVAQGYWMPYSCAFAVCATFCAHIAGALIPVFGPNFPAKCVQLEAPEYSRMIISSTTIQTSTAEAEAYRLLYSSSLGPNYLHSPASTHQSSPPPPGRRLRLKRNFPQPTLTPTSTSPDLEMSEASSTDGYFHSPITPHSLVGRQRDWRFLNQANHNANSNSNISLNFNSPAPAYIKYANNNIKIPNANPILSAIPRSVDITMTDANISEPSWRVKLRIEETHGNTRTPVPSPIVGGGGDEEYDGEESSASFGGDECSEVGIDVGISGAWDLSMTSGAERKAALLLMKLSVKDGECGMQNAEVWKGNDAVGCAVESDNGDNPRIKRRRATSM